VLDGATDSLLAWVDVDTAWGEVEHLLYNRRFDKVYGTAFSDGNIVQRIVAIDGAGDSLVAAIESEDLFFMIPVALTGDDRYLCHLGYMEDSFGFAVIDCERDSVVALLQSNWTQGEMVSLPGGPEVCFVAYRGVIVTIDGDARAVTDTLVTTDRYAPALLACDAERDRLYVYCPGSSTRRPCSTARVSTSSTSSTTTAC
jgi:hypothetical protein